MLKLIKMTAEYCCSYVIQRLKGYTMYFSGHKAEPVNLAWLAVGYIWILLPWIAYLILNLVGLMHKITIAHQGLQLKLDRYGTSLCTRISVQ